MSGLSLDSQTRPPIGLPLLIDLIALGLAGAGNALLAARLNLAPLALGLIGIACLIRLAQTRLDFLKLPLHIPWLVFLVSAWIGVTISFDPAFSLRKFDLILGGIALYYVIATTRTEIARRLLVWGLLLIGAGVAVFYLTQNDFSVYPTKVHLLDQIGFAIHKLAPQLGFHTPHPNLMAGIILLALPFSYALMVDTVRHKQILTLIVSAAFALLLSFALVMTTSRGALLALALVGGASIYVYGAIGLAKRFRLARGIGLAAAFNVLVIVLLLVFLIGGSRLVGGLENALGSVNSVPRPVLYQQVFQLGQDYAFTGAGLDTFSPNYSTYMVLIYVHLLPHAHDLYLQVWFEQGILGLVAFLGMIAAYYFWVGQRRGRMNWLALAAVAATTLMLLHGLVDVLFYFSRVISLMFIPLGLTVCALEPFTPVEPSQKIPRRVWVIGAAAAGIVLVLFGALLLLTRRQQLTAQWVANWGSLTQARVELSKIQYPHPTYSEVRRTADLQSAENLFVDALRHDPNNRTAHARLGMIALDRGEFGTAIGELQAAYQIDTSNRAVIKALGYAYVWQAQFDQADPLLKQIPEAAQELSYTVSDWRAHGRNDLAANAQKMIARLKNDSK